MTSTPTNQVERPDVVTNDAVSVVLHADDDPAFFLRLSHERIAERSDLPVVQLLVISSPFAKGISHTEIRDDWFPC